MNYIFRFTIYPKFVIKKTTENYTFNLFHLIRALNIYLSMILSKLRFKVESDRTSFI